MYQPRREWAWDDQAERQYKAKRERLAAKGYITDEDICRYFAGIGLTGVEPNDIRSVMLDAITADPIEAEVAAALTGYKMALARTAFKGWQHRFLCWVGDKESRARADAVVQAEERAQQVICKSPQHRLAFEQLLSQQPEDVARKDKFLELLKRTFEA